MAAVVTMISLVSPLHADDGRGADAFCEREISEFNSLLRQCKPGRDAYWRQRYYNTIDRYNTESAKMQSENDLVRKALPTKDIEEVLARDYLNKIYEVKLVESTSLIEDLGRELLNDRAAAKLSPVLHDIDAQFQKFQGKKDGQALQPKFMTYVRLKREASRLEADAPVKETYIFQPKPNAYASDPIKTVEFTMHDWNSALSQIDRISDELQPVQDSLHAALFFAPKDPAAWLTVAAQLSFLLVAMAGWIKSYQGGGGNAYLIMLGLVLPSMALSVILILYSADTILNLLRQAIIPAGFIIFWVGKEKTWWPWIKAQFTVRG